jgi:hypothetical protein
MNDRHLTYCCPGCWRVKNQDGDGSLDHDWCTMADYVARHPVPAQEISLSEFYCTDCSMSYDRLVQYGTGHPSCLL